jgi:hypothetical protein
MRKLAESYRHMAQMAENTLLWSEAVPTSGVQSGRGKHE